MKKVRGRAGADSASNPITASAYYLQTITCKHPVESQQYDRPQRSHQDQPDVEPCNSRAAEKLYDEPSDEGSYYPYYDRDHEAARIPSRHDQLGQHTSDEPYNDPAYDALSAYLTSLGSELNTLGFISS